MSLYVRVFTSFYTHRKTLQVRRLIGDDALWILPRLWAYAAEHEPDGVFKDYTASDIAAVLDYKGDASSMLQALLQAGFMDKKPLRIHNWGARNAFHQIFSERARKAAQARWSKEKADKKGDKKRKEQAVRSIATSIATSIETESSPSEVEQPFRLNGDEPKPKPRKPRISAGVQRIADEKELARIDAEVKAIRECYDSHQTYRPEDRAKLRMLKARRQALCKRMGTVI